MPTPTLAPWAEGPGAEVGNRPPPHSLSWVLVMCQ